MSQHKNEYTGSSELLDDVEMFGRCLLDGWMLSVGMGVGVGVGVGMGMGMWVYVFKGIQTPKYSNKRTSTHPNTHVHPICNKHMPHWI